MLLKHKNYAHFLLCGFLFLSCLTGYPALVTTNQEPTKVLKSAGSASYLSYEYPVEIKKFFSSKKPLAALIGLSNFLATLLQRKSNGLEHHSKNLGVLKSPIFKGSLIFFTNSHVVIHQDLLSCLSAFEVKKHTHESNTFHLLVQKSLSQEVKLLKIIEEKKRKLSDNKEELTRLSNEFDTALHNLRNAEKAYELSFDRQLPDLKGKQSELKKSQEDFRNQAILINFRDNVLKESETLLGDILKLESEKKHLSKRNFVLRIRILPFEIKKIIFSYIFFYETMYYGSVLDIWELQDSVQALIEDTRLRVNFLDLFKAPFSKTHKKNESNFKILDDCRVFKSSVNKPERTHNLFFTYYGDINKDIWPSEAEIISQNDTDSHSMLKFPISGYNRSFLVAYQTQGWKTFSLILPELNNQNVIIGALHFEKNYTNKYSKQAYIYTCRPFLAGGEKTHFALFKDKYSHLCNFEILKVGFVERKGEARLRLGILDYERLYFLIREEKIIDNTKIESIHRYEMQESFDTKDKEINFDLVARVLIN